MRDHAGENIFGPMEAVELNTALKITLKNLLALNKQFLKEHVKIG